MAKIQNEFRAADMTCKIFYTGGVLATIKGEIDSNAITIMSHGDTLGAMVRCLMPDGRIGLSKLGGFFWEVIHGENAMLKTSTGTLYSGTILYDEASYHINKEMQSKKWTDHSMYFRIDQQVNSKKELEDLGIQLGDFITFDPRPQWTDSGFIKSRFLDDKASVAVMLTLARTLATEKFTPARTVHFLITPAEEIGLGGSIGVPEATGDLIAIDIGVVGKNQNSSESTVTICAKDSANIFDVPLRQHLIKLAQKNALPYVIDILYYYGSDIFPALSSGIDARTALIGPGVHNSHGYERTHLLALKATHDLLYHFLRQPI
ncbi:M42 family metallopeptidase [candidate division CSSED10-310 bacterium]|uniref:M42 family metallopeptidase n=1 Tax=candidate division CSSED10-310 bacterium TaxID=2855610 RepID=A0ABV6YWS7_UNCC1